LRCGGWDSEDRSLWQIWDNPNEPGAEQKLNTVPAGQDVDREGYGEILIIAKQAQPRHAPSDS